jgi:hypothetical protein
LPERGLIVHSVAVATIFLVSIPIAYRFGPDAAQYSWLSLLLVRPILNFGAITGGRRTFTHRNRED